ncbi:Homeobox protein six1b [Labeo rohita]|uniref:Homeobox protein six1b n=1 Tax=Labeo rohita TaxID=84645 RepID=A0ABQ8M039_LABRO|nr:Homeobox protein six1b [Labeo rohita]
MATIPPIGKWTKPRTRLARHTIIPHKIQLAASVRSQQQAFSEPGLHPSSHTAAKPQLLPASAQPFTAAPYAAGPLASLLLPELSQARGCLHKAVPTAIFPPPSSHTHFSFATPLPIPPNALALEPPPVSSSIRTHFFLEAFTSQRPLRPICGQTASISKKLTEPSSADPFTPHSLPDATAVLLLQAMSSMPSALSYARFGRLSSSTLAAVPQ